MEVARCLGQNFGRGSESPPDSVDMEQGREHGEVGHGGVALGDEGCLSPGAVEEAGHGPYVYSESQGDSDLRLHEEDGGGVDWTGLFDGRAAEEWESLFREIQFQDGGVPEAACDFLRKL